MRGLLGEYFIFCKSCEIMAQMVQIGKRVDMHVRCFEHTSYPFNGKAYGSSPTTSGFTVS
jgi:hypothetical protein